MSWITTFFVSFAAIIWEYLRAIPGALEQFTLQAMGEFLGNWAEVLDEPGVALFLLASLFVLWLAIVIIRQLVRAIASLVSGSSGGGPLSLGLR